MWGSRCSTPATRPKRRQGRIEHENAARHAPGGFDFARTVRELDQDIPILFMTARDDFAAKQRGFQSGIDDYMVKPVDLDELLV